MSEPLHPLSPPEGHGQVTRLTYHARDESSESYLDLVFKSDGRERSLRFFSPTDLKVQPPFPDVGWLQIHNVHQRQMGGIGVRVSDGEMDQSIRFYARAVEET